VTCGGASHLGLIPIVINLTVQLLGAIEKFIDIIAVIDGVFSSRVVLSLQSAGSFEIISEVNPIQTGFILLKSFWQISIQLVLKQ
jgi:hypothetical protein